MHLRSFRPGLAAILLALAVSPALRAEGLDAKALERDLKKVADHSIPRTVLIKVAGEGGMGAGSGAIISPDGYILTCSHVIEIGTRVEVISPDGTSREAKVVGRNKRQDFALIKVEAAGLPHFALGDSDGVKPGDWVVALGHPGGPYPDVQPAFAAGKVRALHVKLPVGMMQKYYNDAIMTDIPIFAGDSGGPLVNLKGELVGINGAIVMINEFAFAVPLKQIQGQLDQLKQGQTLEGEPPGPDAWKEMSKVVSPEDYQKVMRRAMKNLPKLFGGKDNPFGELFGENSPFKDLFGGQGGPNGGNGGLDLQKMMEQLFGGQGGPGGGEMPDLQKIMDQLC
jgi:S1-C subfamily serine protease